LKNALESGRPTFNSDREGKEIMMALDRFYFDIARKCVLEEEKVLKFRAGQAEGKRRTSRWQVTSDNLKRLPEG